jgi:glyceraldehyde 3-phosphate dehydrogenase
LEAVSVVYRVAINGFGRIGRNYVRAALERAAFTSTPDTAIEIVAINDLYSAETLAHLLAYDSTFGPLREPVEVQDDVLTVGAMRITMLAERNPAQLPWADLGVDLVIEATGKFRSRADAGAHLKAGARKVLLSVPGKDVDGTVVLGVSADDYSDPQYEVVSAASCTTNCAAPMVKVLHDAFGVQQGFLTTVHAYTNDQVLLDSPHKDPRRARTAAVNMIPTSTGAAKAIGLVLPELAGRLNGVAIRVPVENGSITDLSVILSRTVTATEVNDAFAAAATGDLNGVLRYSTAPLVSRDIVGDPASCVFDAPLTQADGNLVTVFGWYDNEWGYTNRLLDLTGRYADAQTRTAS